MTPTLLPLLLPLLLLLNHVVCSDNLEPDLLFWQQLEYVPSVADLFDQARHNPMIANVSRAARTSTGWRVCNAHLKRCGLC